MTVIVKSLTIILSLLTIQTFAQTYPITSITISLPANPDANTANWGSGTSLFTITANAKAANGRVDGHVAESKILVTIKKGGAKVCGSFTANSAPASNFNTLTKVWSGSNAVSLLGQGCVLPAGEYELTVQFFGAGPTGLVPFSEEKTRAFSIRAKEQLSYQPPQAISPANGTLFSEPDIIKPITFRWTPVVPRPQEPITYRVKVWQLMQGQNGVQAMRVNQPIITKDVDNLTQTIINNLISGPCLPPYLCDFIWNVQAINREWKPVGGNNGISEALKFTVRPVNDSPSIIALISPANGSTISAKDKPKFTWAFKGIENNYSSGSNQLYKIKIVEIKGNESPDNALRSNKPHFEKDSLKEQSFQYPSSAPSFIAGKKYGWNVSIFDRWGKLQSSTASMFFASSCDVNLILKLRSVECLPDLDRNRRYKINFSSTYSSSTYNLTYIQTGSGLSAYHPSYSPNYSITNISPALQSQNSGVSTTINYSFEVSVPIGQTAIKIGLQGDDKDPGPITCKPGAELDVSLPVCTTTSCDCGEWGTLVIDGRKYECNSRINWTCNKPFQFTSSYTCRTTDANCVAKTTWEVKKGDTLIKSGTGSNTLSDGFSLMANGIYTLTLNANCGDKKCLPCTYTIIVDDCKPVTCDCGTWRPLLINGKSAECGSKIPWNCNKPFDFASTYLCSPNNESCAAKTRWTVSKDGKVIQQGTGTNSIKGSFTPSTNGTYTLTLDANCGEKECKSCTYTIVVEDCRPVLSCVTPPNGMVAWWTFDEKAGQPLVDRAGINNAGTGFYNPLSVPAKVAGGLKFDGINNYVDVPNHAELNFGTGDFSFDAWIQTDDAIGLKDLVDKRTTKGYLIYLVNGKLGFLLRNSSITNYNSPLFVADGKWHHIAITVARENKNGIMFYLDGVPTQLGDPTLQSGNIDNTSPLRIGKDLYSDSYNFKGILDEIELFNRVLTKEEVQTLFAAGSAGKCKDVVPVCDCGTWRPLLINGKSIECGSKIPWNCNKPFDFASTYLSSPNNESCAAKTRWTVSKDGKVVQQETGTNSIKGSFTPSTNGTYTLTLDANCGGKECKSCTYTIVVEDCRPVLSCVTPPKGMVAWWTFDEKAGQPLVDRAGINNAGTSVNNPLSVPAKVAGGLKFDGINNYVDVPNHAELNFGTGDFSFDAWIQTDDAEIIKSIIDKRSISIGYSIFLYKGRLSIQLNDSGPNTNYISPLFVADGKWHHIAITVARKDKKGILFYLDGVPTQLGDPTLRPGNIDNTEPLLIARSPNDEDSNGNKIHFKGILDEIELFNRVLTKVEVQTLFAAGSAGKCKDVVPVCDCGTWRPLLINGKSIECGSKIPWNCNKPFDFASTYLCSPNNESCAAKTRWTVSKDGKVVQQGTGTNSIKGSFTPSTNGTYTLTLDANCGEKECKSCTYTIVVEDCKDEDDGTDSCKNNLIRNGGFDQANVSGTMPLPGTVQHWVRGYGSPIVDNSPTNGFIEKGYIKLAGNINNGQAVAQGLNSNNKIISGKKYKLSVAVRFLTSQNTLDYVKIRVIAYNGNIFSTTGIHPQPSTDVAIIGRSGKIRDCNDWSVIELPVWTANKDFSNIAINAFTNDGSNASVWIDNITICESAQGDCDEVQVESTGNPIMPAGYGDIPPGFACQPEAEEDDYYNGSLQDLYPGYNGTTDLYSQTTNPCFSIGGTLPPEVNNYNCDDSLRTAGINMTCEELQAMLNQEFTPTEIKKSYLPPILTIGNIKCDRPGPKNMENMPFQGRDIIYIHGLQLSHIIDRANGDQGATGKWPNNQSEYYSGYYKNAATNNMLPHISHFLRNRGNLNRFIIVSYDCSESAEVAVHAILAQIREAMENGTGVQSDPSDPRKTNCFGRDYIMISHSTGALVADVALSIANKTKTDLNLKTQYGDIGLISDRCKGRVSIQGAYSGSNLAKIAVVGAQANPVLFSAALTALAFAPVSSQTIATILANTDIIPNSILVDLVPSISRSRWGSYINDISVPVFTIAGGHPSAILGPLKYSIHKGFDDGVESMDAANGNNNSLSLGPSSFNATPIKVFDMGIPLIRGINYYLDQKISQGVFAAASTAYLSPTGMVVPVSSINVDPQNHFNNHYSFIQSSKEHWFNATEPGSGNNPCDYSKTLFGGSTNNEEELVVTNASLFTPGLIDPSIISQMGETLKDKHIDYPWLKLVYRYGIPRPTVYWKRFYIWKRTYHKLIDNCMYDVDYAYKYLFNQ